MLSRSDLTEFFGIDIAMDLPVIPTQLASGQRAACYRLAAEKHPCHALMMGTVADTSPTLPLWLCIVRVSQP